MTARVGDTITYTITLENSAMATADWTGVTVTDALPDGVTFTGNVQKDGQATTEYSTIHFTHADAHALRNRTGIRRWCTPLM